MNLATPTRKTEAAARANSPSRRFAPRPAAKPADLAPEAAPQGSVSQADWSRDAESGVAKRPSSSVHRAMQSPGAPLDSGARTHFERRFGHDLSRIRIHTGDEASEAASSLHASAFTLGSDIVFGRNRYAPGTAQGRLLLLHELRHAEQQRSAAATADPVLDSPTSTHELQVRTLLGPRPQPIAQQRIQCAPEGEAEFKLDGAIVNSVGREAFGDTAWPFLKAVIEGFVGGLKGDIQAGRAKEAKEHLEGLFVPWHAAKFYGGYLIGLFLGLISPITDLVKGVIGLVKFAISALEWLAKWSPAGIAMSPERQQKIVVLTQKFGDLAVQLGEAIVNVASDPKGAVKRFSSFLDDMMQLALGQAHSLGAKAAHSIFDFLKQDYYDMGESIGKVIGTLVVQVLMLVFSDAIANAVTEAAALIGKAAQFVAGKAVEFFEMVKGFASKVIGAVRSFAKTAAKLFGRLIDSVVDAFEAFKALFTESEALETAATKTGSAASKEADVIDLAAEREKRALAAKAKAKAKPVVQQRKLAAGAEHEQTVAKFGDEEIHEHMQDVTEHRGQADQLNKGDVGKENVRTQRHIRAGETDLWEGDSGLLGQRLGPPPGPGYQAHHIVPSGEGRAAALRDFMRQRGWKDINDVDNGVWLPTGRNTPNLGGEFKHEFTFDAAHFDDEYFQRLEDILMRDPNISPSRIRFKLRMIRSFLQKGQLPPAGL